MNPNKALWEKGDFTQIAAFMRESGEARRSISRDDAAACGSWIWAAEMARRRFRWPVWELRLSESTLPGTSSRPGTNEQRKRVSIA